MAVAAVTAVTALTVVVAVVITLVVLGILRSKRASQESNSTAKIPAPRHRAGISSVVVVLVTLVLKALSIGPGP